MSPYKSMQLPSGRIMRSKKSKSPIFGEQIAGNRFTRTGQFHEDRPVNAQASKRKTDLDGKVFA